MARMWWKCYCITLAHGSQCGGCELFQEDSVHQDSVHQDCVDGYSKETSSGATLRQCSELLHCSDSVGYPHVFSYGDAGPAWS